MIEEKNLATLKEWSWIRETYYKWTTFMEKNITFSLEGSFVHTKLHCARVLLYALAIGQQMNLPDDELDALGAAAVFHDSRRQNDWSDVGHGQRAAAYYEEFCQRESLFFDKRTYLVMAFHDRDDCQGVSELENAQLKHGVLLYQIFKDADALDRFRLGSNALDINMLRTDEALTLVEFARKIIR